MSDDAIPESDRVAGAPHPREVAGLFGQEAAERAFLEAHDSGRLHHAWLLSGPRGVGKATLAWRIARFLLSQRGAPDEPGLFGEAPARASLDMSPDDPVFRRIAALGEPRLILCRRPWDEKAKKLRTAITVEEVRRLRTFFGLSAADGGWRVAIIDAMDEMNTAAANALLKLLEEPPERTVFLLVCHQPGRLLPTIRSRCRSLRLAQLDPGALASAMQMIGVETSAEDAVALAELSGGSAGEAVRILGADGLALYADLVELMATAPAMDRRAMSGLSDSVTGRAAEARYDTLIRLVDVALLRIARAAVTGELPPEAASGEAGMIRKLGPGLPAAQIWAETAQHLEDRIAHARAVNLDPGQVMLDTFISLDAAARRVV